MPPETFAQYLTEGIYKIKDQEGKPIAIIEDELGYDLGKEGGAVIGHWRRGRGLPHHEGIRKLAQAFVKRGAADQAWLKAFLQSADYPAPEQVCQELFPHLDDHQRRFAEMPLNTLPEPAPLPTGSRMPFSKNPLFVGREQNLLALAAALKQGRASTAATGLGGIGKTQLASEFVHRYGRFFAGGVFWLSFDNPEGIATEIAACGGAGALQLRPNFADLSLDEQVQLVQAAWQESVPRLLIFDNCEAPELLARWRPTSGGCRILITSRRSDWEPVLGVQLHPLNVFSRAESLTLLGRHHLDTTSGDLDAIAEELGDLPLALHLAGRYLRRYQRAVSSAQYLAQLRNPARLRHPSLQSDGISPTGHVHHVVRTFALSYDHLDAQSAIDVLAHRLLVHLAVLAPGEPVQYDLLMHVLEMGGPVNAFQVEDALARLIELGLIEVIAEKTIRMHRLVAAFVSDAASKEVRDIQGIVEQFVHQALEEANQAGTPRVLLHWQIHLRHVVGVALARRDEQGATLSMLLGRYLWLLGDYTSARLYFQYTLEIHRTLWGEEHIETADSYHEMGTFLCVAGELEEARVHLERALAIRLQTLGEEHKDTAMTIMDLAELFWAQGHVDQAVTYSERALTLCIQILGEDDPVTADAANNLAICLLDGLGEVKRAHQYMEQALRIRRQKLGEEHPHTALAYHNMGYLLQTLGDLEAAWWHYEEALSIRQRLLGETHPDIAHSLLAMGILLKIRGKWDQARENMEEALNICAVTVGNQHSLTASCFNELGALLLARKELSNARTYLEQALASRQKIYKVDHPHLAVTLQNLGLVLLEQGDLFNAERYLKDALDTRQRSRRNDILRLAENMYHLGRLAQVKKDTQQARELYTYALEIYKQHLGASHPDTQNIYERLGHLPV